MKNEIYFIILQLIICYFNTLNAMMGPNVRSARQNEFPSAGAIVRYDPLGTWEEKLQCTGTLVVRDFILSAAHCFHDANTTRYEIYVGGHVVQRGDRYFPVWWITYDQYATILNPEHTPDMFVDDLMLIKIVGVFLERIASPLGSISPVRLLYGLDALVLGCGKQEDDTFPRHMKVGTVTILDHKECVDRAMEFDPQYSVVPEKYLCTIGNPYTQLRVGDSGGPLMYFGTVIGISVACFPDVRGPFIPNRINIHANIYSYQPFINQMMDPSLS